MPRSSEAKLRRRNRKKSENEEAMKMLGNVDWNEGDDDDDVDDGGTDEAIEMFPSASSPAPTSSDFDDKNLPKSKKLKRKAVSAPSESTSVPRVTPTSVGSKGGIKTTPLILLILMVGTTVLPALIYTGDYVSKIISKNNVLGNIGFRLGIGAVPKKRVLSFYEKHAPTKVNEVPSILSKHYGDYPTLIKKLERKYQDYGYFIGWEEDEAPMRLALEKFQELYDLWITRYWNMYAPQRLKIAFRNIRYNLTFLVKKGRRIWKKHVWPVLEPIFGVPDGAAAQKRKDAAEARKRKTKGTTNTASRKKRKDFRDDEEE